MSPPVEKQTLTWITHRPAKFESQRFAAISQVLSTHGWSIKWLEIHENAPIANMVTWLAEKLDSDTKAVFFADKDLTWFKQIISTVRGLQNSQLAFVPFFWIYEGLDHHLMELMSQEGFTEFFEKSITPYELLLRLKLRRQEADLRLAADLQLKDQAVRGARNETIIKQREEFLSVCAHDLRSPLGLIQTSASVILKEQSGKMTIPLPHYELLSRVKRQATHALTLVNDLLDVMSFEQGFQPQYQLLALNDLLTEFHRDYKSKAEQKRVQFHYNNEVPEWKILGDSDRIRQLLQNLFENAIKFTDSGKNIYLSVSPFQGRRRSDPEYPMIIITVKDEGKGMAQRELQRIFDRFTQIKDYSKPEGRGLGLTVAKQISTLHDGNIWVESTEGKGSTFYVLFPHVISPSDIVPAPRDAKAKLKVLVAEPSLERRGQFFSELEKWGVEVHFAKDGADALAMLYFIKPDLFIVTANLARMNVNEVLDLVKSDVTTATIPVVLVGEESEKVENRLDTHRFDRYVKLPLTQDIFTLTLRSVGKKAA